MTESATVLGAGNMGTSLAQVIAGNGHPVRLWSIEQDVLEDVRDNHRNTKYVDDIALHENIEPFWELEKAIAGAKLLIVSVPSQIVRRLAKDIAPFVQPGQVVLNVAKGLEAETHHRMSQIICEEIAPAYAEHVGSMGGPAVAIEMARGLPVALIIAVTNAESQSVCQRMLQNNHCKVETTHDVPGLELCATLKNIYAISLGMADGIGYGTNTKALLASVSLREMTAIVGVLGGELSTVYGLAGVGDLITTGFSPHGRNRTLGEHLGANTDWRGFIRDHTVEGVVATQAIGELIANKNLQTPLFEMIHAVLFSDRPAPAALTTFLRDFTFA
ncbi:MAG: NAD(P)H-dependent glycerol-3-phosphate dehydrogenase [Chloroflexota bacterium]